MKGRVGDEFALGFGGGLEVCVEPVDEVVEALRVRSPRAISSVRDELEGLVRLDLDLCRSKASGNTPISPGAIIVPRGSTRR